MSRRGHALVLVALTLPIATAACSSGSDSSPSTSLAETIASTTDPSTTDATTSTSATTTEATTTTIDPADAFAADVEADLLETLRLTDEAFQDPTDDAKVAAALEGHTNGNLAYIQDQLDVYRSNNWVARPNTDFPAATIIEVPARRGAEQQAIVQVCEVSSWITVEVGAGPNGSDAIVDPDITSYRSNYVLELVNGRWLIVGSELLSEFSGSVECPAG